MLSKHYDNSLNGGYFSKFFAETQPFLDRHKARQLTLNHQNVLISNARVDKSKTSFIQFHKSAPCPVRYFAEFDYFTSLWRCQISLLAEPEIAFSCESRERKIFANAIFLRMESRSAK